ncbi:MAG: MarR family transcriptional regulator [Moraxellaceae bacterium]|nr:MarR family transcriptional regulator [Moraxellaceae bacterium]
MATNDFQRQQAATGLDQLAALVRAQSWKDDGTPPLPPTQSAVLRMLDAASGALRAGQVAQRLGVSAASLSDSLKALEARGWITRDADPDDGRAVRLALTRKGRSVAKRLNDPQRGLTGLMGGLGEQDLGALLRVTQLLVYEAQQQGLANGPRTCLGCSYFQANAGGEAGKPHFCGFIGKAFGDPELRVDCAEQSPGGPAQVQESVLRFRRLADLQAPADGPQKAMP